VTRRPIWLGTGIVLGVGGTLWAERRVRRRVRRALDALSASAAGHEAVAAAREMGFRVRDALDAARAERSRHEAELWRRLGERPLARVHAATPVSPSSGPRANGGRHLHR
jgi:hypothetical protein